MTRDTLANINDDVDDGWVKLSERRPTANGYYLVIWSEPYLPQTTMKTEYFGAGRFANGEVSGRNEILYWSYLPLAPDDLREYRELKIQQRLKA